MRYAAMEFVPTITRGYAHPCFCFTSMIQLNTARKRKQRPPLNKVQLGVHIRFTMGQIPVTCSKTPAARSSKPAVTKRRMGCRGSEATNHCPAKRPRIMVPKVGMKLRVRYPPPLYAKGCSRGNKLRNHRSKVWPRLLF